MITVNSCIANSFKLSVKAFYFILGLIRLIVNLTDKMAHLFKQTFGIVFEWTEFWLRHQVVVWSWRSGQGWRRCLLAEGVTDLTNLILNCNMVHFLLLSLILHWIYFRLQVFKLIFHTFLRLSLWVEFFRDRISKCAHSWLQIVHLLLHSSQTVIKIRTWSSLSQNCSIAVALLGQQVHWRVVLIFQD